MHREDPNKKILWGEGGMKKIENKNLWMKITTKFENKLERNLRGKFPESFQKVGCWWGALKNVSFKWSQHSSQPHATDHTSFILGIHPWGCEHACSWMHGCIPSTAWKVSKYRVISGPSVPVFGLNTDQK